MATRSSIEVKFADVMRQAAETLKVKDVNTALQSVEAFFVNNQMELKEYFDAKTLEETLDEMENRINEVRVVVSELVIAESEKIHFLQKLKELFVDEYRKREEEMSEGTVIKP